MENQLELKFCNGEELIAFYMDVLKKECDTRNTTIEQYMIDYLIDNHGREFWHHVDELMMKQMIPDCDDNDANWDAYWDDEDLADEADRLLDEYEALQAKA